MLHFGVVLHGAVLIRTLPGDAAVYAWIEGASRVTRMQAFFLIAGFLAARVLLSRDAAVWMKARTVQLAVPLVFVWATVSRLTSWLHSGDPFTDVTSPDHLWFLVVLLAFSALTYWLETSRLRKVVARVVSAADRASVVPFALTLLALVFGAVLAREVLLMTFPDVANGAHPYRGINLISRAVVMVWFYLAGFVLGRSSLLSRLPAMPLAFGAALSALAYLMLKDPHDYGAIDVPGLPRKVTMLAMHFTSACASVFFALAVVASAARVRTVPRVVTGLAEASYTLYLLHLFFLSLCFAVLAPLIPNHEALFVSIVVLASSLSVVSHFAAKRVPLLFFLLNGAMPRKRRPRDAPSVVSAAV